MTTARISWADLAARGARVVFVCLIDGVPSAFVSRGATVATVSVSGGTLDPDFWPGTGGGIAALARPWLDSDLELSEELQGPGEMPRIGGMTLRLGDWIGVDADAPTKLLASQLMHPRTLLRTSVSASATSLPVSSVVGFPSSGAVWLEGEAVTYASVTSSPASFDGCTRGALGSQAVAHTVSPGPVPSLPEVWGGVPHLYGRRITLWAAELIGTDALNPTLLYTGRCSAGSRTGGNAAGADWTIEVESAWNVASEEIALPEITLSGFHHRVGNVYFGAQPLLVSGAVEILDTATAVDQSGHHPDAASYIDAVNRDAVLTLPGTDFLQALVTPDGRLQITITTTGGATGYSISAPWDVPVLSGVEVDPRGVFTSARPFPTAWVPLRGQIVLAPFEAAALPAVPFTGVPLLTSATLALVPKDDGAKALRLAAAGGPYETALPPLRVDSLNTLSVSGGTRYSITVTPVLWSGEAEPCTVLVTPTAFALAVYATGPTWPSALQAAAVGYTQLGVSVDTRGIDWTRVAEVVADAPTPGLIPSRRYVLQKPLAAVFREECALHGLAVVPYRGRIAAGRIGDVAPPEPPALTLRTGGSLADPEREEASTGLTNAVTFDLGDGRKVSVVDATSSRAYGPADGKVETTVPPGALDASPSAAGRLQGGLIAAAGRLTGAYRRPYEVATFRAPLTAADVQCGEVVRVASDWLLPTGSGTRGLADRAGVLVGRRVTWRFSDGSGSVALRVRLGTPDVRGFAPAAFVKSIVGAVVTLDDTTALGAAGASPTATDTDAGASWFGRVAGAEVRLVNVGTTSPLADETFTVVSVSGAAVTLDGSPSGAMAALAGAGNLQVVLRYADWTEATAGQKAEGYAWECDRSTALMSDNASPARYSA